MTMYGGAIALLRSYLSYILQVTRFLIIPDGALGYDKIFVRPINTGAHKENYPQT